MESRRDIFKKLRLLNHDNDVIMDKLVIVNAKIPALIYKNALLRNKIMDLE